MPVIVQINVTPPPDGTDVASLHVFESANPYGPFAEVQSFDFDVDNPVLSTYDVDQAISVDDWFAVQWKDSAGAWIAPLSPPMRGGNDSLVTIVVDRVLQRDHRIDRETAKQEAEGAIEQFFGKNPYSVSTTDFPANRMYRMLNGMTYLVMARSYMARAASTNAVESATLGIVSFKNTTGATQTVDINGLIELANINLDLNTSLVLQMEDIYNRHPEWHQFFVDWEQLPWIVGIPHGTFGS